MASFSMFAIVFETYGKRFIIERVIVLVISNQALALFPCAFEITHAINVFTPQITLHLVQ